MKITLLLLALMATHAAQAGVPGFLPYSGRLTDGTLAGASTTANLRVLLYTCACPSDATLDETICTVATRCAAEQTGLYFEGLHPNVPIVDGYFSVMVGMYDASGVAKPDPADSALTPHLPLPARLWMTVSASGMPEMAPRQAVGSAPYATNCGDAGSIQGSALSDLDARFVNVSGDVVTGDLSIKGTTKVAMTLSLGDTSRSETMQHDPLGPDYAPAGMGWKNGASGAKSWGLYSNGVGVPGVGSTGGYIVLYDGAHLSLLPGSKGNVGVGTTSPQAKLHVVGSMRFGEHRSDLELWEAMATNAGSSCDSACGNGFCLGAYTDNSKTKQSCSTTSNIRQCICAGKP